MQSPRVQGPDGGGVELRPPGRPIARLDQHCAESELTGLRADRRSAAAAACFPSARSTYRLRRMGCRFGTEIVRWRSRLAGVARRRSSAQCSSCVAPVAAVGVSGLRPWPLSELSQPRQAGSRCVGSGWGRRHCRRVVVRREPPGWSRSRSSALVAPDAGPRRAGTAKRRRRARAERNPALGAVVAVEVVLVLDTGGVVARVVDRRGRRARRRAAEPAAAVGPAVPDAAAIAETGPRIAIATAPIASSSGNPVRGGRWRLPVSRSGGSGIPRFKRTLEPRILAQVAVRRIVITGGSRAWT